MLCVLFQWLFYIWTIFCFRNLLKVILRGILSSHCTTTGHTMCQECTVGSWMLTWPARSGKQRGFCFGRWKLSYVMVIQMSSFSSWSNMIIHRLFVAECFGLANRHIPAGVCGILLIIVTSLCYKFIVFCFDLTLGLCATMLLNTV